jgi:tetratricopeptide (TPR) repeat protein
MRSETRGVSRRLKVIATLTCLAAPLGAEVSRTTRAQSSTIIDLLNRYERGDEAALLSLGNSDVEYLGQELAKRGGEWATSAGRDVTPHRRLVAATFALEVAGARFEEEWLKVRHLVEWGCRLVGKDPPREVQRLWYLASVSLADGARDLLLLRGARPDPPLLNHLGHAHDRFPDELRFLFASAVSYESGVDEPKRDEVWESEASLKTLAPFELDARFKLSRRATVRRLIDRFGEFRGDRSLGAEAHLRTGRLLYVLHEPAEAMLHFDEVLRRTDDPFLVHLARLFSGRAFEQLGDRDRASRAYRQSLEAVPGAQSASMLLAALVSADGRPGEAYAVMKTSFDVAPQPRDPWRLYGYGSYRFWPQYIAALRREISR